MIHLEVLWVNVTQLAGDDDDVTVAIIEHSRLVRCYSLVKTLLAIWMLI